ncbi:hypothetical protein BC629DRAFT_1256457, partial [Irpex lacteus]
SGGSNVGTHLAAGLGGGVAVLLGAYGYYHFSGAKTAVDSAKSAHTYFQQTKASIAQNAPKSPNEVLQWLRSVAKSYAGVVPGASSYVDSTFDSLDELHDTHGEELEKILQGAYDDVKAILKDVKENEQVDAKTAGRLVSVLGKRVGELNELGKKAGGDVFAKLEEKFPEAAKSIGSSYADLKGLAQRGGPEAKKLAEESIAQIQDILKTGVKGSNPQEAWTKARDLVQEKSQKLKELVWDKAAEEAKENPEVVKLLKENRETFVKEGVSVASLREVLDRVRAAVKEGGKVGELGELVRGKAREGQERGWESLQEWVKVVPGGDEVRMSDVDIQALVKLSQSKSGEAKQLAEETYREILGVLKEKAGKAKKIADEGVDEAK